MKVLVVGSGAREHCLSWKINATGKVKKIFCAPGNGGTGLIAENVNIAGEDFLSLKKFVIDKKIDLIIVGPEAPLVKGIVDYFHKEKIPIFGPNQKGAMLEGSKVYAKNIMEEFNIPTAKFVVFDDLTKAKKYVSTQKFPLVIKADGLAAGKGVIIAKNKEEANKAIEDIMGKMIFGEAGRRIIIEDCLVGEELSVMVLSDGKTIRTLVSSQDHKRVFDNDLGPNTGGMGAYSPVPLVNEDLLKSIEEKISLPLIKGLYKKGDVFQGVLYLGLMIVNQQPYVLEFNVRFGDPECQVILPKLNNDLLEICQAVIDGQLDKIKLSWDERYCLSVVLTSAGYPGKYEKGKIIYGLNKLGSLEDILVFHAGTTINKDNQFITTSGRVINVVGLAETIEQTREKVYKAIENISFEGMHYRKDIGMKALKFFS